MLNLEASINLRSLTYLNKNECNMSTLTEDLKGVFAKNEREYRLTSKNYRW